MEFQDILYEVDANGVAVLTLNKPEKLNALSWGTWAEIEQAVATAEADDATKVIVITGAGRGFSAGTDLTATNVANTSEGTVASRRPFSPRTEMQRSQYLTNEQIYHCRKPTIAAVNGVAAGAGFSLALACDIRIVSSAARFSAIFVKRAIVADTGMTWFLPRIVGMEQALKMMYTGRMVPADEALAMGLVSEVVEPEALMERALALATEIARGPSVAIELDKRLTHEAFDRDLRSQIEMEQFLQQISQRTEDVEEGRKSFLEKRDPVFKGR